jgi:hypothetical protein
VCIIADLKDRIHEEMRREQLSHDKARSLLLASRVEIRLVNGSDISGICAQKGEVTVELRAPLVQEVQIVDEIRQKLEGTPGLEEAYISVTHAGYASW